MHEPQKTRTSAQFSIGYIYYVQKGNRFYWSQSTYNASFEKHQNKGRLTQNTTKYILKSRRQMHNCKANNKMSGLLSHFSFKNFFLKNYRLGDKEEWNILFLVHLWQVLKRVALISAQSTVDVNQMISCKCNKKIRL